ncbi:MAG: sigma-70 family RNA polymerase sigma factor [Candidatus Poribacteria bacterium]|nr:sigma-70 family RNA polymerase sigma factor [Candidatus Poribacteria bacterium]
MVENDVQLIYRTLAGDETAFTALVRKYQKGVHALAWRKVGDFHVAEEITQDTFLQVHKKLTTLQNPNQFAGWLYVITNRMCIRWFKNKKPTMLSLEKISRAEVDKSSYKRYVSEQRETEAAEHRYEMVKELLKKLPESERTVVTLHYLGEMTAKEIGNFLGVSANTIKSRLQRARKRLRAQNEESLVREVLGSFQLPTNLTESIMRQAADLKLTPPQVGKPLLPWAAFGTAVLLIVLMLGTHNQYLARFQQPYSFEAESEPTVEIVDAPITLHLFSKPAVRNQIGRAATATKNIGTGLRTSEAAVATPTTVELPTTFSTAPWTQMGGPPSGVVFDIFETSNKTLYLNSSISLYRLTADTTVWTPVNVDISIEQLRMPMAEHAGTLYIVAANELLASTDDGETWNALGARPEGHPAELIVIDAADGRSAHERVAMYLAFWDNSIFRSTDAGKRWTPVNNGLTGRKISKLVVIEGTIFTGTDRGLYRLNADVWEQLPVDTTRAVHDLVAFEDTLYVGTGRKVEERVRLGLSQHAGRIFKSNDLGTSWTEITPKGERYDFVSAAGISIAVGSKTVLARGLRLFRSTDSGVTWTDLGLDVNFYAYIARDENTFYKSGNSGVYRTTDGGESWHHFMDGIVGTGARDLVVFNNSFYVHANGNIVQSADDGESWTLVPVDYAERASEPLKREPSNSDFEPDSKFVSVDNIFYGIESGRDNLRIFHLSGDNTFIPVQGVPDFGGGNLSPAVLKEIAVAQGMSFSGDPEKDRKLMSDLSFYENYGRTGAFAVSGDTFYVEYKRKLFKWKLGDSEWKNTGLIDTGKRSDDGSKNGFKLAVSAETVYVGKRDGRLFQSLDGGNSWRDITTSLPLRFTQFKEIIFVDSTAYVATDSGILTSQTGTYWRVLTDTAGGRIVIDRFAVNGTSVYGAGDAGVYRLDDRKQSEQIYPNVPDRVLSLAVKNDKLYIVTRHHGMFQIPLAEAGNNLSRK